MNASNPGTSEPVPVTELGQRIGDVFALAPDAVAVEFGQHRATWGELARAADRIEALLVAAGVDRSAPIGWIARNRPAMVAAFGALVRNGRTVAPLRSNLPPATFRAELLAQRLQAVIGDEEDWQSEGAVGAALQAGSAVIAVSGTSPIVARALPGLERVGPGPHRPPMPGVVLERMTSGTTGAPKRIPVQADILIPALQSGEYKKPSGTSESPVPEPLRVKSSPAMLLKPFSHAGGLFGLLMALYQARPMILFEKFVVAEWVEAVRRYKPKSATLVPAMIQMIMEAGVPKEALQSLLAVRAGTAPLDPEMQVRFEERYGMPILVDYGAAEFIGGVAGWSLGDYRRFGRTKRGSVGRARPDVQVRIMPAEDAADGPGNSGAGLPPGGIGLLQIKCDRFGPDWIHTNDLARVDEDGFIFLHGRADDAINRGGFKILPDEVAAVLRRYPGVRDAAVLGAPDPRLGQIPVAAIEMSPGVEPPPPTQLEAFARSHLSAYQIPKTFHFVAALPRTASLKICRPELRALLGMADSPP